MIVESNIAKYLRQERKELKQRCVAEQIGIKQARFSQMMNGHAEMKADEFMKLCFFLNVSPEVFIKAHKK